MCFCNENVDFLSGGGGGVRGCRGGRAWLPGGVCVAAGWGGACVAAGGGVHGCRGGVRGCRGGLAAGGGKMCGCRGGRAWLLGGACMERRGGMQ